MGCNLAVVSRLNTFIKYFDNLASMWKKDKKELKGTCTTHFPALHANVIVLASSFSHRKWKNTVEILVFSLLKQNGLKNSAVQ